MELNFAESELGSALELLGGNGGICCGCSAATPRLFKAMTMDEELRETLWTIVEGKFPLDEVAVIAPEDYFLPFVGEAAKLPFVDGQAAFDPFWWRLSAADKWLRMFKSGS